MRVLVIRYRSMGDVICVSPLIARFRERRRAEEVHFVTDRMYAPLFLRDPGIHTVHGLSTDRREQQLSSLIGQSWDFIVDLQNNALTRRVVNRKSAVNTPVGRFDKMHGRRWLLLLARVDRYGKTVPVPLRYIRAAGYTDTEPTEIQPLRLYPPNADLLTLPLAKKVLSSKRPKLAFFPFSAWKNKEWPLQRFAEVGRHFSTQGWDVLVFGSRYDNGNAQQLVREIGSGAYSLAGGLALDECAAMLSRCSLALGGDTGLSHCARGCGVPTGILYGPTTHHFGFYPYGSPRFCCFETSHRCRPCHPHGGNRCLRLTRPCLTTLTSGSVIRGLESLLS